MRSRFLDLSAAEIAERVERVASAAAGGPVIVRVGPEAVLVGTRNLGVDLPHARPRRSATATLLLRRRVAYAIESAGVTLAPCALAERVPGDLRCSVQVREVVSTSNMDASQLMPPRAVSEARGTRR